MTQLEFGMGPSPRAPRATPERSRHRRRTARDHQLDLPWTEPVLERIPSTPMDPTAPSSLGPEALQPSIRAQARIEGVLRSVLGPKVLVKLTKNRTTMISFRRRRGVLYVRLHALFGQASTEVLHAVAAYVEEPAPPEAATLRIDAFLEQHRDLVDQNRAEQVTLRAEGKHHDLGALFDTLNGEYFGGQLTARITWSRSPRGVKRTSMRLGSYCDVQNVIRIHPALDQPFVPRYFVASVVFHEMLHELHGAPELESGKRSVHPPAFLADERRFADYERSRRWEQTNIHRLLRY